MKIYVVCDLEGICGVVEHKKQCWKDGEFFSQARRLATLELNALVDGAIEGGATEVVAWDGHCNFPGGFDIELLHPKCKLIMEASNGGPVGLDSSFDAVYLLGLHAMAGTPNAVLCHSFMRNIQACWLNGRKVGEIEMNFAVAGQFGIPAVFISGDRAAVEEAKKIIPEIESVVVKEGLSPDVKGLSSAPTVCLSPQKARELIRESAKNAISKINIIKPYFVDKPYTLRTQFTEPRYADEYMNTRNSKRIDSTSIEVVGNDLLQM